MPASNLRNTPLQPLSWIKFGWRRLLLGLMTTAVAACHHQVETTQFPVSLLNLDPPPPLITDIAATVLINLQDPGYIVVRDGKVCGVSSQPGREDLILFDATETLPAFVSSATVFLNGWEMSYLDGEDHEIGRLGIEMLNIQYNNPVLQWQVRGFLRDHDFKEPYQICAYYTALGWDPATLHALADDGEDGHRNATYSFFPEFSRESAALISVPSYLYNPQFIDAYTTAILPRGFAFGWEQGFDQADHDLLQIAYHRQPAASIVGPLSTNNNIYSYGALANPSTLHPQLATPGTAVGGDGYVSWISSGIFKDDHKRRKFFFYDVFSGLSGGAVSVLEPPYIIRPRAKVSGGLAYTSGEPVVREETVTVENLPYRYALPVLTGWNLSFPFQDEEVKRLGIWVGNSDYDFDTTRGRGTLRYSVFSVLHDDEHQNNAHHTATHKTMILGLDRNGAPDLLPIATGSGTGQAAFCTVDSSGALLQVTIANHGDSATPPSQTEVRFTVSGGSELFVLETPSIASNGQVTLSAEIPGTCFGASSDCHFQITANANGAVLEAATNNNTAGGLCTG